MLYNNRDVDIATSARRHGVADVDTRHALAHLLVVVDVDDDASTPKMLVIGPDRSGNALEVVAIEGSGVLLVIHAMKLRKAYEWLLDEGV